MTDYLPLLSRAVSGLERNTGEARRSVYDRARQALLKQLRSMNPPLAESEITRERLALEEAIRRIEAQVTRPAPPPPPPAPPPVSAPAARAPAPGPEAAPLERSAKGKTEADSLEAELDSPPPPPVPPARREPPAAPAAPARREPPLAAGSGIRAAPPLPGTPTTPPPAPAAARRTTAPPARNEIPADAFDIGELTPVEPVTPAQRPAPSRSLREPRIPEPANINAGDAAASSRPGPYRGRSDIHVKADARKALKAKLIVGGSIAGLLLVALVILFMQRDRIFGISASRPSAQQQTAAEPPKATDRVGGDSVQQQASRPPAGQHGLPAAVAQRAVLYEENPSGGGQQLQTFVGTVVWKTETVSPGPGRPPELGLRIEVEIPDRKMTVLMTVRRNPDTTLPASHTVEVQFTTPGDPFGGVSNVPGLRAKTTETAQGAPLSGLVVRVMPGFFLIGLSAIDADREQNLMLLRERGWLDLPFVYNNGRRAVLVIEKGGPGERVVNEALSAWGG